MTSVHLRQRDAWVQWLRNAVTQAGFTREAADYVLIWDRTDENGVNVSAGVYVLRLMVDGHTRVRKTVLLPTGR